jgi:hypothetical protein
VSGPLFTKPSRRALIVWASLAALNLAAGVVISSQPQRLTDLDTMQTWGRSWLLDGEQIYRLRGSLVDYPPNAIVVLSPLGLLAPDVAAPMWLMLNVAMAVLAPYLAARFFRPHDPFRVVLLPILMFLCWGGIRTLTQFSLVALVCSMLAMRLADRTRVMSGFWLGLALVKPQVAVPVLLWTVFTRRWAVAMTAVATVAALFAVFCLRSSSDPFWLFVRYAATLAMYHTGDALLTGLSELRPLILQIVGEPTDADAIAAAISLGLLGAIGVAGIQEGAKRRQVLYAAPPLVACWSLLTVYHLTYGFVILLPVMMMLALNDSEPSGLRKALFWGLQLGMMFDVPGLSRRLGLADTSLYATVLFHADRVLIVGLFVGLIVLAWNERVQTYEPRMRAARNS